MVNPHLVLRTSLRQGDGCAVDYLDFRGGIQFNIDGRQQITHFNVYVYIYIYICAQTRNRHQKQGLNIWVGQLLILHHIVSEDHISTEG